MAFCCRWEQSPPRFNCAGNQRQPARMVGERRADFLCAQREKQQPDFYIIVRWRRARTTNQRRIWCIIAGLVARWQQIVVLGWPFLSGIIERFGFKPYACRTNMAAG